MNPHPQANVASWVIQVGQHAGYELNLTSILLFGIISIVRWVIGPLSSPGGSTVPIFQLLTIGASVALCERTLSKKIDV